MIITIYKIKDLTNGKFYIGGTKHFKKRIRVHKSLQCNTSSSKSIILNNNYKIHILDVRFVDSVEEAKILENLYVLIARRLCKDKVVNENISHRFKGYRKWYDRQMYLNGKREYLLNRYYASKGT